MPQQFADDRASQALRPRAACPQRQSPRIHGLTDVARTGARIALPGAVEEAGSRARYRAAIDELIGKPAADALFAAEVGHFPGRIGIVHRDFPEMVARGYADVALTQYHLISYWTRSSRTTSSSYLSWARSDFL